MSIGIYALYWQAQDLVYIGKTITLDKRYKQHLGLLTSNKHFNYKVQQAYSTYGVPEYVILKEVVPEDLNKEEISLISEFGAFNTANGLNLTPGGDGTHGEDHPGSLYSNACIEAAFLLLWDRSSPHKDIAIRSEISLDVIKAISSGKLHGWLHSKHPEKYTSMLASKKSEHNIGELHSMASITNDKVLEIFEYLVNRDIPLTKIANVCDVSYGIVSLIACGSSHKWLEKMYPDKYKKMLTNLGKLVRNYPKITNGLEVIELNNLSQFCTERNLQASNLSKVLKGTRISHKGWRVYKE